MSLFSIDMSELLLIFIYNILFIILTVNKYNKMKESGKSKKFSFMMSTTLNNSQKRFGNNLSTIQEVGYVQGSTIGSSQSIADTMYTPSNYPFLKHKKTVYNINNPKLGALTNFVPQEDNLKKYEGLIITLKIHQSQMK